MLSDNFRDLIITFESRISVHESDSVTHKHALRRNAEDARYITAESKICTALEVQ
jgi:hypothetical protein